MNATEARHANAASALEAFFRYCKAGPEYAQRYPDLEQELWQMVDGYEGHPSTTSKFDPDSSEFFEEEVDGHSILRRVVNSLRSDSWIPYLPFLLHWIASGDHRVAWGFIDPQPRFTRRPIDNSATWASLRCHADGRFADRARVLSNRAAHPRMVYPETPDLVPALCAAWHDPTAEPVDRTPVASNILTLLLSGEFDPTTRPRWSDLAAGTLRRSHSFVVPMAGHGVGMDTPCRRELVGSFLNAPDVDPSPACSSTANRKRSNFRVIVLYHPVSRWHSIMWRPDTP